MTAVGALLAVLVVLHVEGVAVEYHAPAAPDVDEDELALAVARASFRLDGLEGYDVSIGGHDDRPELVTDGGVAASSPGGGYPDHDVDPWAIVDVIKDAHRGVDVVGGLPPQDILPGFGKQRMSCGDYRPCFCGDCARSFDSKTTCDRSTCPHCAPNWARRRATYACRKLAALRAYVDSFKPGHQKLHHLSISPQKKGEKFRFEGDDPAEVRDSLFHTAYAVMDELGIEGFVVYHPFVGEDGSDIGFWKDLLFNWTDWNEARRELLHHPHVHVFGVGEFVPGKGVTDVIEAETGWVIKRITRGGDDSDDKVSIGDNLDLARAVTYSLSHCGIYETDGGTMRYAGRWHGENVDDASVTGKYEMEWERIVRTVSTTTLGLKKKDVLCSGQSVTSTQTSFGTFDTAMGSYHGDGSDFDGDGGDGFDEGGHVDATGEVIIGSSGPVADDDSTLPDTSTTAVTVEGGDEPCEGPLLDITRAPEFLEDDEWRERAPFANDLDDEYQRWRLGNDFLVRTQQDLDAMREGRWDDVTVDLGGKPPPD